MTDKRFWRTTPTVLNALSEVHADCNSYHNPKDEKITCDFVDEAPFLI